MKDKSLPAENAGPAKSKMGFVKLPPETMTGPELKFTGQGPVKAKKKRKFPLKARLARLLK
jgi:hypothetical protein